MLKNRNIPLAQNEMSASSTRMQVESLQFGLFSPEEITRLSVAEICSDQPYDELKNPSFSGINDPRMGTNSRWINCLTCLGTMEECPGHFGHINLARKVYHVGYIETCIKLLRCICYNCSKLLIARDKDGQFYKTLSNIKNSKARFQYFYTEVQKQGSKSSICDSSTGGCGYTQPKLSKQGLGINIDYIDENFDQTRDRKTTLSAEQAHLIFKRISDEEMKLLGFNPQFCKPEWMLIKVLLVAPPPVRPSVQMPGGMRSEDDLTFAYQQIIKINKLLQSQIDKGTNQNTISEIQAGLQYYVATLMDNNICGQPKQKHKSGKTLRTIRSRLKGKEGRLRGNLMGKRVDFSSRTVITPDPNLKLDQLGVPLDIATNLTFPETVTPYNYDEMKKLIQNGPSNWPGAKYIIRHDDRMIDLSMLRNRSDAHIEIGYRVERHIKDGDYVVFNRQPSLHKMSIMGHRVKILPYSTFRMNLSVTSPYNADFDGDEMNMHVPQSYETVAEVKEIMLVQKQIMNPQSNKPVMGIVQDSLLGCMIFTSRDTFVGFEDFMNLSMQIDGLETLPQPAILKPRPLWTGKQIFSLILPRIHYNRFQVERKSKNNQADVDWCSSTDQNIKIKNGELLCGQLTKSQVGNTGGGLIHIIWKEKGPDSCKDFLSLTQNVINNWLVLHGFTVGVQDIITRQETKILIANTLTKQLKKVKKIILNSQLGMLKSQPGKSMVESFESQVNQQLNDARDKSGNIALKDLSNLNRLRNMVQAGSKGNNINISQIMACVGQQNVEGKRIPFGFQKRTLPHFAKDDFSPESKGFVQNSYFSGLTPSELFFHAMGGREGLIDTAVKTAETGYISRRLMKALEDVMVKYDGTVRTAKEQIVQFVYGEDGIQGEHIEDMAIESIKLNNKQFQEKFNFLTHDIDQETLADVFSDPFLPQQLIGDPLVAKQLKNEFDQITQDRQFLREKLFKLNGENDQVHMSVNVHRIIQNAKHIFEIRPHSKTDLKPQDVAIKLDLMMQDLFAIPVVQRRVKNNKIIEMFNQANENATYLFKIYLRQMLNSKKVVLHDKLNSQSFDWILGEIKSKFDQSLVHPGEMVGSIAAQGMGEPATQMTLNTFHFAGVSAKNVTLGVPRIKEIINVSKSIKTPSVKIFLKDGLCKNEKAVTELGSEIEYTTLQHLVQSSQIFYDPDPKKTIIQADQSLVALYNELDTIEIENQSDKLSPWVMRFELDSERMVQKGTTITQIDKILTEAFGDQISIMHSDENAEQQVLRMRIAGLENEDYTEHVSLQKELERSIFKDLLIKGHPEIQKVTYTKHMEVEFDKVTGAQLTSDKNWIIETDGVCLQKILGKEKVDHQRTVSNDCVEIERVLGIEASRQSLINEMRFVLNSYGIYVNYRHLATLTDIMTQRGKLMSIARHGINRIDSGALRKCSFEETVEILLEAAGYSEKDSLSGITENIVMGQLAPCGTGSFSLQIDSKMIQSEAVSMKDQFGGDYWNESPGMQFIEREDGIHTPMLVSERFIEDYAGGGATTCPYGSPYAFSPAGPNQYGSPNYYASPAQHYSSPGFSSPMVSSPIYGGNKNSLQSPTYYQSPEYQANLQANGLNIQSPGYSKIFMNSDQIKDKQLNYPNMNSPAYSPNASNITQRYALQQMQSPARGRILQISPAYSPSINCKSIILQTHFYFSVSQPQMSNALLQSPNFTSAGQFITGSPAYNASPMSPINGHPPKDQLQSPAYQRQSPAYNLYQERK